MVPASAASSAAVGAAVPSGRGRASSSSAVGAASGIDAPVRKAMTTAAPGSSALTCRAVGRYKIAEGRISARTARKTGGSDLNLIFFLRQRPGPDCHVSAASARSAVRGAARAAAEAPDRHRPVKIVGNADSSGRPAQMTLTFGDEQVDADLAMGSFRQRGGPDFSLYIDSTRYKLSENEGRCYVAASGNAGAKCYLELAFLPNSDAASVASTLLSSYGAVTVNPAEKTEAFGGYSAIRVTGSSAETDLEACVVSVNGGSLTVVLCVPGMQSADADLLRSSLDSLIVQ